MEPNRLSGPNHQPGNSHIKGLDGLRAIAALLVFWYHTWGHWNYPTVAFDLFGAHLDFTWLFHYGTEGVSIFFVISGFLLSLPFWRALLDRGHPVDVVRFFKRRFLRIYPAYFVALTIFALFYDTWHPFWDRLIIYTTHLLLIHNLAELTIFSDSSPLWSVATEFQMYLILPVLFVLIAFYLKKGNPPVAAAAILFTMAGLVAYVFWHLSKAVIPGMHLDPNWIRADGDVLPHVPPIGIAYFASGIAFGYVYLALKESAAHSLLRIAPELGGVGILFLIVPAAMSGYPLVGMDSTLWPRLALAYGVLVAAIALGGSTLGLTWLLELPPLRYLGMISYSFYLYHDFMLHIAFHWLPDLSFGMLPGDIARALTAFVLTVVVASISYYAIETRFHQSAKKTTTVVRRAAASSGFSLNEPQKVEQE